MALVVSNDIYFFHRGNAQKAAHFVHHSFQSLGIKINMKIASIKFKFAPMLKINRISSKSEENSEAKE